MLQRQKGHTTKLSDVKHPTQLTTRKYNSSFHLLPSPFSNINHHMYHFTTPPLRYDCSVLFTPTEPYILIVLFLLHNLMLRERNRDGGEELATNPNRFSKPKNKIHLRTYVYKVYIYSMKFFSSILHISFHN